MSKTPNTAARAYVFTINNYTDDDLNHLADLETVENVTYAIWGFETGESGTPHIQGYIECKPMRMKAMQDLLGGRAYLAKRKGTRDEARNYCMKEGEFMETGAWKAKGQGRRSDLDSLVEAIKNENDVRSTMEAMPATYSRHMRFAEALRSKVERDNSKEFRHVTTTVLYGASGTGKTRYVHEHEPDLFWVHPDDSFPFDGYDGEAAIAFDDFYGNVKHHEMLRILDGYQYLCNVKGGHRYARWTRVYITSNAKPEEWYSFGLKPELARRLTHIISMEEMAPLPCNTSVTTESLVPEAALESSIEMDDVTTCCNEVAGNNMPPLDLLQHLSVDDALASTLLDNVGCPEHVQTPCPPVIIVSTEVTPTCGASLPCSSKMTASRLTPRGTQPRQARVGEPLSK